MKAGKGQGIYKVLIPDGSQQPAPPGLHPAELQCKSQDHRYSPRYRTTSKTRNNPSCILLVIAVLTLIVAAVVSFAQVMLFKEYRALKAEVDSQMQMLEALEKSPKIIASETDSQSTSEVTLSRNKRSDLPPPPPSKNNRRRHERAGEEISVVHLVINTRHQDAPKGQLKTGNRGEVIRYWKYSDDLFNQQQNFAELDTRNGHIEIAKTGLYYIYSQMTYFDRSGRWSHIVQLDDVPFIKCLASEWGIETDPETGALYNTIHQCHTAAVTSIRRGQVLTIRSMYQERVIHPEKDMTFVGIVKLT